MNKIPKITIITVCYNSAKTLKDTIMSIRIQDYKNIEYIVVDGGSKDETIEIINDNKDVIDICISEPDKGIYDAMNKGIQSATGDIIGILNSDDFYPNKFILSNVISSFRIEGCDAVYGDLVYVDSSNVKKIVRYWKSGVYNTSKIKNGWMLPHPTFFVKSSIYKRFGLYDLDLKLAADYDMILRLIYKFNIDVVYIPMILVNMRVGGLSNNNLFQRLLANKEDSLAWSKNGIKKPRFLRLKKPFHKVLQFFIKPKP